MPFRPASRRNAFAVALSAILAAVLATACTSAPRAQVPADAEQVINWWTWNPNDSRAAKWVEAFEKEHPNITVKHRFIQFSDYVTAVRLAATTPAGPDVFGVQAGVIANQFSSLAVDLAPFAAKDIGSDWKRKLLYTDQLAVNGKQVALPWMITGGGLLWYNEGLLEQAGVSAPPSTLGEWLADCKRIAAIGKTCFVHGAKEEWVNIDMYQSIINQIAPGAFYGAVQGNGPDRFDSAPFVRAFDVWNDLFSDGIMPKGALARTHHPDANDQFLKGDAAFILNGTWRGIDMSKSVLATQAGTYGEQIKSQVFLPAPFPDVVGGAKEVGRLFGGPDVGWAISARSNHQAAAFTFVQWLVASEASQTIVSSTLAGQPALATVPADDSDLVSDAGKTALKDQANQLSNLIGMRQIPSADVQSALGQALSAVASGLSTPADAARSVQSAIDSAK